MAPNEQWDDFALGRQFDSIDKRLEMHEHALTGLSHFPTDVATAALEIKHLAGEVAAVAATCKQIRADWQESISSRQKGRTAIVVAVITGCCTVLAALVVLLSQLGGV